MGFIRQQGIHNSELNKSPPIDCTAVYSLMTHADPVVRRQACRDVNACPDASHILVAQLNVELDPSVREVVLTSLTRIGDEIAVAGLAHCLRSEDVALRNETIDAMKQLNQDAAPVIRRLLVDADPDVRIFAVNILESLRHPDVERWLIDVIAQDTHINVCATAVDLLGEVGTEQSLAALHELSERFANEPYIQFAIRIALRRIHEA